MKASEKIMFVSIGIGFISALVSMYFGAKWQGGLILGLIMMGTSYRSLLEMGSHESNVNRKPIDDK